MSDLAIVISGIVSVACLALGVVVLLERRDRRKYPSCARCGRVRQAAQLSQHPAVDGNGTIVCFDRDDCFKAGM